MRLNKYDRQKWIVSELAKSPALRVGELAERLRVTTETIRRDLQELTELGLLARTYGGAIKPPTIEPGVSERQGLFVTEREAIARRVVGIIRTGKHVYIGSGATTTQIARRIAHDLNGITVITHAIGVATVLAHNPMIRTILLPGQFLAGEGAVHGATCLRFIDEVHADFAIIGASGLTDDGPSEALPEMAEVYSAMIRRSTNSLVVADHSKFNRRFTVRYARWREVDALVTDQPVPPPLGEAIQRAGTTIALTQGPIDQQ